MMDFLGKTETTIGEKLCISDRAVPVSISLSPLEDLPRGKFPGVAYVLCLIPDQAAWELQARHLSTAALEVCAATQGVY